MDTVAVFFGMNESLDRWSVDGRRSCVAPKEDGTK